MMRRASAITRSQAAADTSAIVERERRCAIQGHASRSRSERPSAAGRMRDDGEVHR